MIINHNISALNTHRQLGANNNAVSNSLEKLSSGLKINRAGDDAAGLAISEKMRGQIRGLDMAAKNAHDGISLIQTAEGALNETHAILQRMRELAVQSSNDTNNEADRGELQKEIDQLAQALNDISADTEFNTKSLLDGSFKGTFHIGANSDQNLEISINNMSADALGVKGGVAGLQLDVSATETATIGNHAIEADKSYDVVKLDKAATIGGADYNYVMQDAEGVIYGVSTDGQTWKALDTNTDTGNVGVKDINNVVLTTATDFDMNDKVVSGKITVTEASGDITLSGTATAEISQDSKGLAAGEYTVVGDTNVFVDTGHKGLTNSNGDLVAYSTDGQAWTDLDGNDLFTVSSANALTNAGDKFTVSGDGGIDISSQSSADKAITTIQSAIDTVSAERSKLGAVQNRLEHTINNLGTSSENLTAAESRIRDVDMAKEMMEFTKNNILTQAAQAMLAQANQTPQGVLQLLR